MKLTRKANYARPSGLRTPLPGTLSGCVGSLGSLLRKYGPTPPPPVVVIFLRLNMIVYP